ncbi:hypothetical protein A3F06_04095 [candidate division TM6 bacterium RIFCSPHIGHO2_12_FULL_36_22]|nr:MAG: hypothetical protein A3F06_04095 [candidate division TM6 bacterium RIFCSPHIGHO2_12_FULL_36_22]HLB43293.1 glutamine synthetase family protein [Gammaproteobacteria bacterium]
MKKKLSSIIAFSLLLNILYAQDDSQRFPFYELVFTPINVTQPKTVTIPDSKIDGVLQNGTAFDGSSIKGYGHISDSDKLLKVDRTAHYRIQNNNVTTGLYFCDVYENENTPYLSDPRTLCAYATKKLKEQMGYIMLVGIELEFYLVKKQDWENNIITPVNQSRYFDLESDSNMTDFKLNTMKALVNAGVDIEKWHSEVGPGQYEISIQYNDPIRVADQLILAKHIIGIEADRAGLKAVFMPKPITKENGTGLHIHFSLWDSQKNVFYDKNSQNLSPIAYSFLAGVMKYISDVSILFNGHENSFKRLVPGFEAPIYLCYSEKNRSAAIRIPATYNNDNATRFELRCADTFCNPYLAFSALLLTGLQGLIDNEQAVEPVRQNLYSLSEKEICDLNIFKLPLSLEKAKNNFEASQFVKTNFPNVFRDTLLSLYA